MGGFLRDVRQARRGLFFTQQARLRAAKAIDIVLQVVDVGLVDNADRQSADRTCDRRQGDDVESAGFKVVVGVLFTLGADRRSGSGG